MTTATTVRRDPATGGWVTCAVQRRPNGAVAAECAESFRTSQEAYAAMDRIRRAVETREPWPADRRGAASERREVVL